MINIKILTAYPEMFPGVLAYSLIGKALKENIFTTMKERIIQKKHTYKVHLNKNVPSFIILDTS